MMKEILFLLVGYFATSAEGNLNIAVGKSVSASSNLIENPPELAVDGDQSSEPGALVFQTSPGVFSSWWSVHLSQELISPRVFIFFRTGWEYRRNGVRVALSTVEGGVSFCHVVTGATDGSDIPDIYDFTCAATGRYLNISTVTDNDGYGAILDFGEVEVYARAAFEVSIFTKYILMCEVSVSYSLEPVDMALVDQLEEIGLDTRIECMHKCEALDLCIAFEYQSPTCTFWGVGSSNLSGTQNMWKRQY